MIGKTLADVAYAVTEVELSKLRISGRERRQEFRLFVAERSAVGFAKNRPRGVRPQTDSAQ